MSYIYSFEKLEVWKDSKTLVLLVYAVTEYFPKQEQYGLTSQLQRAAVSVSSNIVEGNSRISSNDKARFTTIAYSSLMEVLNQIIIAYELKYIEKENYLKIRKQIENVAIKINALKKYQKKSKP